MSVTDTKPETAQQEASAGQNGSAVAVQTKPAPQIDNKINTNNPDTTPNQNQQTQTAADFDQAQAANGNQAQVQTSAKPQASELSQASSAGAAPKVNQTREQVKKERTTENPEEEQQQQQQLTFRHAKIRLIPIWLRLVIIFLLLVFALVVGAMVGYGIIGGGNPWEVLKQSTWTHIVDLINKE
ncbi:DNA-directed RNA polymerase subunit beta [Bacillus sp. DNRA2]|uniref:DNA-directed RNA polymerase subunit beta n=1 Tax=Bacillus sp. DNRA2 TaxID=2723053 RepID=UPI00145E59DE|nr:DNA-directed RNA polymerase subunit beta [Bacillus sp. DNRA2]NMD70105.1 DNA-directed RNA polymerase subunit beta [Bacillus sp. DNRA2]